MRNLGALIAAVAAASCASTPSISTARAEPPATAPASPDELQLPETRAAREQISAASPTRAAPSRSSEPAPTQLAVPTEIGLFDLEARAHAEFVALAPQAQREFIDWFAGEAQQLDTYQNTLIRFVMQSEPADPGLWPELATPAWFDPEKHAPKQPIARHVLGADDPVVRAAQRQILGAVAPRRLRSGWTYDYVSREPRKLPGEDDPVRRFDNALLGLAPNWDYVEALVERMLDDGSQQKALEAFSRPYTDRVGGVYPGITLYDAYTSRTEIEMPDVDTLGIMHDVLDDWTSWTSIVPETEHEALYARIGGVFQAAQHHRSLRVNLARAFLCGSTELRDGYQHNLDRFHAMWESVHSNPSELATRLPPPANWAFFLQSWADQLDRDETAYLRGVRRHFALENDAQVVRTLLLKLFDQYQREHTSK